MLQVDNGLSKLSALTVNVLYTCIYVVHFFYIIIDLLDKTLYSIQNQLDSDHNTSYIKT